VSLAAATAWDGKYRRHPPEQAIREALASIRVARFANATRRPSRTRQPPFSALGFDETGLSTGRRLHML